MISARILVRIITCAVSELLFDMNGQHLTENGLPAKPSFTRYVRASYHLHNES
jgi:hypothetical protein